MAHVGLTERRNGLLCNTLRSNWWHAFGVNCVQVVLAAYSDYLVQKFTEFPASEVVSIDLMQYPPVAVFAVLRFVYTGELEVTRDTVGCVWKVAEDLGICTVVGLCEDFLGEPNVDNAVYHFAVAERFGLTNLGCRIYQFIVERQAALLLASRE